MQLNKNSKIFVAGHKGMVGSSIVRYLKKKKYKNILTVDKKDLDLLDQFNTQKFLMKKKPHFVIIAAVKVGGIMANNKYKAEFILKPANSNQSNSLIIFSWVKINFFGSSCIYPKFSKQPIKEEYLLDGKLEKLMMLMQLQKLQE